MPSGVALQLSADRTWRAPQFARDLGLRTSAAHQRRHAVSFFLGELVVLMHHCILFLGGNWMQGVSQLALLFRTALRLLCESATPNIYVNRTLRNRRCAHDLSPFRRKAGYVSVRLIQSRITRMKNP